MLTEPCRHDHRDVILRETAIRRRSDQPRIEIGPAVVAREGCCVVPQRDQPMMWDGLYPVVSGYGFDITNECFELHLFISDDVITWCLVEYFFPSKRNSSETRMVLWRIAYHEKREPRSSEKQRQSRRRFAVDCERYIRSIARSDHRSRKQHIHLVQANNLALRADPLDCCIHSAHIDVHASQRTIVA